MKFAFYAGAVALFGAIGWTVLSTREYPPETLAAVQKLSKPEVFRKIRWENGTKLLGIAS